MLMTKQLATGCEVFILLILEQIEILQSDVGNSRWHKGMTTTYTKSLFRNLVRDTA